MDLPNQIKDRILITIDPKLKAKADAMAKKYSTSRSELISKALDIYLKRLPKEIQRQQENWRKEFGFDESDFKKWQDDQK